MYPKLNNDYKQEKDEKTTFCQFKDIIWYPT